jgi:hypothetical protein
LPPIGDRARRIAIRRATMHHQRHGGHEIGDKQDGHDRGVSRVPPASIDG